MIEALPRREREVFETLCRLGEASTGAVRDDLGSLSDSAVRTLLTRLERKGLVVRQTGDVGVVYRPAPRTDAIASVGSSRVDLQACKLEYSIVSPK